ncbi:MAG TPA: hypothetical protein VLF20_06450, partial [Patescibacteria group bacterium]|nr:hypothetical protein [Patescibacteria group bacterium]
RYGSLNWWTDVSVTAVRSDNWTPIALPDYEPDTYHGNRLSAFIFRKYHEHVAKKALTPQKRRVASTTR